MKSSFPTRTATAKLGELGVSIVSRTVSDVFGWLFKRNHQEHDFGIDGQVELVTDQGQVSGQMFAVQIKCGMSFLAERNQWGYVYRGEPKHFNYLANYPLLILICLCDPESSECYWEIFDARLVQPTGAGWKLTIPFENKLGSSKERIEAMLPAKVDAAAELQSYWALNSMLVEAGRILYTLDRQDIESRETDLPREFFDRLRSTREIAHACEGKVEIMFSGYDDDERELFEIEEVRQYVALLDQALPEIFFFLRREQPTFSLMTFALCQTDIEWPDGRSTELVTKQVIFGTQAVGDFLMRHWGPLNELTDWTGMPIEENKRISFAVLRCLGIKPLGETGSA